MITQRNSSAAAAGPAAPFKLRPRPRSGLGALLLGKEEEELVLRVLRNQDLFRYYGGDADNPPQMVQTLEEEFRTLMGAPYAVAVSSGTAALDTALGALGIGRGDEVVLPAFSWVSCYTSVVRAGARPVLAEIDESLNIDPKNIESRITSRTKAIMVIHFQGAAADMDAIMALAKRHKVAVLEDCAESAGVLYKGRRVGTIGEIGIFSFQHQKTVTSGEGGMVVTNDGRLFERAVRMTDVGMYRPVHAAQKPESEPAFCGGQYRMGELVAAVALAQLRKLESIRAQCQQLYDRLDAAIGDLPDVERRSHPDRQGATRFEYYFLLPSRGLADAFRRELNALNVNCRQMTGTYCHYRRPYCTKEAAQNPANSPFLEERDWPAAGYRVEDFPQTESIAHRFVALPLGVQYTEEDIDYIAKCVLYVHDKLGIGK